MDFLAGLLKRGDYKYGTHLISLFQDKIVNSLETQRPIDKEKFISTIVKKNQYNRQVILDFFNDIEIGLYRPLIR